MTGRSTPELQVTVAGTPQVGSGMFAVAALPAESDTMIIDVDGVRTEIAVSVDKLFYSVDGLTWLAVVDSPTFGKPLLASTPDGSVIAVDEYRPEDREIPTTETFIIRPAANTTGRTRNEVALSHRTASHRPFGPIVPEIRFWDRDPSFLGFSASQQGVLISANLVALLRIFILRALAPRISPSLRAVALNGVLR